MSATRRANRTPLVLMADYFADPLWRRSAEGKGGAMVPLESLPLGGELIRRLRAWAAQFDARSDSLGEEWQDPAAEQAWLAQGRELRVAVQDELGPEYDVTYLA